LGLTQAIFPLLASRGLLSRFLRLRLFANPACNPPRITRPAGASSQQSGWGTRRLKAAEFAFTVAGIDARSSVGPEEEVLGSCGLSSSPNRSDLMVAVTRRV
jgi:hypothetical protein